MFRTRRNQNKYHNLHKDVSHEMKDYIQLQDQIELLLWDGHQWEFVEKPIIPASGANRTGQVRPHPASVTGDRTNIGEPEHIVYTIFGGTATSDMASSRRSYAQDVRQVVRGEYINMAEHIVKMSCQDSIPIAFTEDEATSFSTYTTML